MNLSRVKLGVGIGVFLFAIGDARAQEPLAANQSAAVENVSEAPSTPAEATPKEQPPPRGRKASRKLGPETAALTVSESTPWYRTGLGAMTVVLALLGALYLGVRRWVPSVKSATTPAMSVVARCAVSPKHSLATVQWGRRFVLVGVSNDRMDTLAEITEAPEAAELAGVLGVRWPAGATSFEETLMTESSAFDEPMDENTGPVSKSNAVQDLLKRLKSLRSV